MFDLSEFQTPCSPNLKLPQDPQQPEGHHCGKKIVDELMKEKKKLKFENREKLRGN
jgi:hypothetical protein